MLQISPFLFFKLLILFLFGCNSSGNRVEEFIPLQYSSVPVEYFDDKITSQKVALHPTGISGIFTSFIVKDSILYCGNLRSSKLVNAYDLKTEKLITTFINRGAGFSQGLSVESMYQHNRTLWINDITGGKLFKLDIGKGKYQNKNRDTSEVFFLSNTVKNIISPTIINDSTFIATTFTHKNCRYLYCSTKNNLKKIGELPKVKNQRKLKDSPNFKISNAAYTFKAKLVRNSSEEKLLFFTLKLLEQNFI